MTDPRDSSFDVVVVGGGAGGITAAQTAARCGASVLLVQDGPVGGDCTFTGCVPSKTLIEAAASGAGFSAAMDRVRNAIETIAAKEDDAAMAAQGVAVLHGRGSLVAPGTVSVDGRRLRSRRIVVATGAAPVVPPVPGLSEVDPLTNETLFDLTALPGSLAVVGGGPIGCEMAQAFSRLGSKVTVIEALDRLLPRDEPDASAVVEHCLAAEGITVRTGAQLERVDPCPTGARLTSSTGETVEVERVLVAIGRRPVTDGLGLDRLGIDTDDHGFIVTDDTMTTSARGVWAVGDVTGRLQFTHAAARMAFVAVSNALSRTGRLRRQRFDAGSVPWVTFTDPEVAHVGLSEADAAWRGGRVATVPFTALDRAVSAGRTEGYLSLIAGPRRLVGSLGGGRILGATVVGPRAGELIHEAALAVRTGMFAGRLAQTVHAYPTWSMAVQMAAAQLFFEVDGRSSRPARR